MKNNYQLATHLLLLLLLATFACISEEQQQHFPPSDLQIRFEHAAKYWEEALPVGNGSLGAMVFGGVKNERIQFNHDNFWSGAPKDWNNPEAKQYLPIIREQLLAGDYAAADATAKKMQGPFNQSYQPLGDLWLTFYGDSTATEYWRSLDLSTGVVATHYVKGETRYSREVFSSHPDQVLVIRLKAMGTGTLDFTVGMNSLVKYKTEAGGKDWLVMQCKAPKHVEPSYRGDMPDAVQYDDWDGEGMEAEVRLQVQLKKGQSVATDSTLQITEAKEALLILSCGTSYNGPFKSPGLEGVDPAEKTVQNLEAASSKSFAELRQAHIADHQALFNRVDLNLGTTEAMTNPIDQRLRDFNEVQNDPHLVELLFQYGRYLLIAASRPGTQPPNLQGIWNHEIRPPWSSNWTLNINTEMNFWPAETCNLPELHEPLFTYVKDLAVNGAETAKVNYGLDGWVSHHNGDIWRQTAPVGDYGEGNPLWANWNMSAGWLVSHFWEHYLFSGDQQFLKEEAYPLMKGAAQFVMGLLTENEEGQLVTTMGTSPENYFQLDNGENYSVSMGPTMDMAITRELFSRCIEASKILEVDEAMRGDWEAALSRLLPYKIGKYGQLQEWQFDFEEADQHHRHISHLYGFYPGNQIDPYHTPLLFYAVRRTLERRGDPSTGWSMGWKVNCWARQKDGDHTMKLINMLLTPVEHGNDSPQYSSGGGVYHNLFDAHPPFQIDGNYGATAGIAEMLVQSHSGAIELLPALPASFASGYVKGLRARGGFDIEEMRWENNQLVYARIKSNIGGNCRIRTWQEVELKEGALTEAEGDNPNPLFRFVKAGTPEIVDTAALPEIEINLGYLYDFPTEKGGVYEIVPR